MKEDGGVAATAVGKAVAVMTTPLGCAREAFLVAEAEAVAAGVAEGHRAVGEGDEVGGILWVDPGLEGKGSVRDWRAVGELAHPQTQIQSQIQPGDQSQNQNGNHAQDQSQTPSENQPQNQSGNQNGNPSGSQSGNQNGDQAGIQQLSQSDRSQNQSQNQAQSQSKKHARSGSGEMEDNDGVGYVGGGDDGDDEIGNGGGSSHGEPGDDHHETDMGWGGLGCGLHDDPWFTSSPALLQHGGGVGVGGGGGGGGDGVGVAGGGGDNDEGGGGGVENGDDGDGGDGGGGGGMLNFGDDNGMAVVGHGGGGHGEAGGGGVEWVVQGGEVFATADEEHVPMVGEIRLNLGRNFGHFFQVCGIPDAMYGASTYSGFCLPLFVDLVLRFYSLSWSIICRLGTSV